MIDVDSNTMSFNYSGSNLASVQSAFGRTLTIQYGGDKISSVSDSANPSRSVSYSYTADNHTGYTDPEGKAWSYGYNASHGLTTVKNLLQTTLVTNTYDDTFGRLKSQQITGQAGDINYTYHISGFRN